MLPTRVHLSAHLLDVLEVRIVHVCVDPEQAPKDLTHNLLEVRGERLTCETYSGDIPELIDQEETPKQVSTETVQERAK
jgi:hypothetical protein